MSIANIYSIDGEIVGDSVSGDYLRDALGSVNGTTAVTNGSIQNTYRYKPYGSLLAKTGMSVDSSFQWVGTTGYRHASVSHGLSYVRARHYAPIEGRWTTRVRQEELLAGEHPYGYAFNNPTNFDDPSGNDPRCTCDWGALPPGPILKNPPKNPALARCYARACKDFCRNVDFAVQEAIKGCRGHCSIINNNELYPPSPQLGTSYERICAENFILPGAPHQTEPIPIINPGGRAQGNISNYPKPLPQTCYTNILWTWCAVECKLRVCNDLLSKMNPELPLKKALRQCDQDPNWDIKRRMKDIRVRYHTV